MLVKQSKCRQGLPKNQEILQTSFKSKRAGNLLRDKIGEKGRSQGIELPKMEEQRWPILENSNFLPSSLVFILEELQ